MRIPISKRLRCCAELLPQGVRSVADVGCDHGYLGIYLLKNGLAQRVLAADLREKPLARARENAARFGVADQMDFLWTDGLQGVEAPYDAVVCAGMGGDAIAGILEACPWVRNSAVMLILQPQTSGNDLRRYLGERGYTIEEERLVKDGGYLYFAMRVHFGGGRPLSPGNQYVSPQLLESESPLLGEYFQRVLGGIERAVRGLEGSGDAARYAYYKTALNEVKEMQLRYDNSSRRLSGNV